MSHIIEYISNFLWGFLLIYVLIGVGIFFTIKLNFIQIVHFLHTFLVLKGSRTNTDKKISSFQALCVSLAARVGTGNLAGVAIALTSGGPGAIFWMWLVAFVGMATSFAESTLAQLFKVKDDKGFFRGGPAYYMQGGLKSKGMGYIFAFLLIICFGLAFNGVQANSISSAFYHAYHIPKHLTGIFLVMITALIILGGLKRIAIFAELVVPFMAIGYLLLSLSIILIHIDKIPHILMLIVKSAFGINEFGSGVLGYSIAQALINGAKRGLFSNEAGMGSAPNAAATATPYPPHPASQGYVQMLGVFIDTLLICSATAFIILISNKFTPNMQISGIELTQKALSSHVGNIGYDIICIALFFFAFTSIIANYSYAENNLLFLKSQQYTNFLFLFRISVLLIIFLGSIMDLNLIWNIADIAMGFMALVNLISIILLSNLVKLLSIDYNNQLQQRKTPTFNKSSILDKTIQKNILFWG